MRRKLALVTISMIVMLSCSKDNLESNKLVKKGTEPTEDGHIWSEEDFNCEYVLEIPPAPIFDMLDNPDDPLDELLDKHMYYIAKVLSEYTCVSNDFVGEFQQFSFSRYDNEPDVEVELVKWADAVPALQALLEHEFSLAGLDWNIIKNNFEYEGIRYIITVYLENGAVADWGLTPYVGIGTDLDVDDSFGDFVPFFYNEGCASPQEFMIAKVDPQAVASLPEPIEYNSECLYNPLLIVQLGWAQEKKGIAMGSGTLYEGEPLDTVIPGVPPPGPGCSYAEEYTLVYGNIGGKRYERGKKSEYNMETFGLPVTGATSIKVGWPHDSKRYHMKKIHKSDKNKTFGFNHALTYLTSNGNWDLGPTPGTLPDVWFYTATYEWDWYCKNRNLVFDSPDPGIWKDVKLKLRRKRDNEHYQVMCYVPADWCAGEYRKFTNKTGTAKVLAK